MRNCSFTFWSKLSVYHSDIKTIEYVLSLSFFSISHQHFSIKELSQILEAFEQHLLSDHFREQYHILNCIFYSKSLFLVPTKKSGHGSLPLFCIAEYTIPLYSEIYTMEMFSSYSFCSPFLTAHPISTGSPVLLKNFWWYENQTKQLDKVSLENSVSLI